MRKVMSFLAVVALIAILLTHPARKIILANVV